MTPGGSEFMSVESVRAYYRDFKDRAHYDKIELVKLRRALQADTERLDWLDNQGHDYGNAARQK